MVEGREGSYISHSQYTDGGEVIGRMHRLCFTHQEDSW
jgi:hypothetical protein